MQNILIKQWLEASKSSIELIKENIKTNLDSMNTLFKNFIDPGPLAELTKASIALDKELKGLYTSVSVDALHDQLNMVDLQPLAEPLKELGETYGRAITDLTQKQKETLELYIDSGIGYINELKKARTLEEIAAIQGNTVSELQKNVKNKMTETMNILNQINTTMTFSVEKSLNAMAMTADNESKS